MNTDLNGKRILVVGASSDIGSVIIENLMIQNTELHLTARNSQKILGQLKSAPENSNIAIYNCDVSSENQIRELSAKLPKLDGIVYSAGIIKRFPLKFISKSAFQQILDVNLIGPSVLLGSLLKKKKINAGASVVFISSVGANYASLGNSMYMASKGGLNSFIKGAALELARQKIRVNGVLPGLIVTNLTVQISQEKIDDNIKNYPLQRLGKPEDVAPPPPSFFLAGPPQPVVFLAGQTTVGKRVFDGCGGLAARSGYLSADRQPHQTKRVAIPALSSTGTYRQPLLPYPGPRCRENIRSERVGYHATQYQSQ